LSDTVREADAAELAKSIYRLQFPNGDKSCLYYFFDALDSLPKREGIVRILHYGDSQIEGDRMSSFIRNKLQARYGGSGPGLLPAKQPFDKYFSINQKNIGEWSRYTLFGKRSPEVLHQNYGVRAAYSRFSPISNDSVCNDSLLYKAEIAFSESRLAYHRVRSFQQVDVYGNSCRPVAISLWTDSVKVATDTLKPEVAYAHYSCTLPNVTKELTIKFEGYDSPDIYGVELDARYGVSLSNIAMRGSSGTIFRKLDFHHTAKMFADLDPKLIILQYGGNSIPYIDDTLSAVQYGQWFYSQLRMLKQLNPHTSFVVIGPSDMSHKVKGKFVTYEYLMLVRDAMKKATFKAGFAYWDMYEAMGGHNSMPSWVEADPPLAITDYTHFTTRGAKLMAKMFYNALMIEKELKDRKVTEAKKENERKN
jgi:lysophospholipase L1-like esterase